MSEISLKRKTSKDVSSLVLVLKVSDYSNNNNHEEHLAQKIVSKFWMRFRPVTAVRWPGRLISCWHKWFRQAWKLNLEAMKTWKYGILMHSLLSDPKTRMIQSNVLWLILGHQVNMKNPKLLLWKTTFMQRNK